MRQQEDQDSYGKHKEGQNANISGTSGWCVRILVVS